MRNAEGRIKTIAAIRLLTLFVAILGLGACSESTSTSKADHERQSSEERGPSPMETIFQLKQEAEAGNAEAQMRLGKAYLDGKDIPQDYTQAFEWTKKAAEQGNAIAQGALGWMYLAGNGTLQDPIQAAEWLTRSATQGNVFAQTTLADMYYLGELGIAKDVAKAIEWYTKAAEQGNGLAQAMLGEAYYFGRGVPKDVVKSVEWQTKAAAQGNVLAQNNLGIAYFNGEGVPRDLVLSYAWSNLAAGSDAGKLLKATELRDRVERLMPPAAIAEAQRLSTSWKKGMVLRREGGTNAVNAQGGPGLTSSGTGFVVSAVGHVLTNHHVIAQCGKVKIGGREGEAKLVTGDTVSDIALLQMQDKTTQVASFIRNPAELRQGEDIVIYGYPLNAVLSAGGNLAPGVVSALTGLGNNTNQIQITAPVQPGSSGSPVLNRKGQVVGMVSMKLSDRKIASATGQIPQNVNFAVNAQTLRAFLDANKVPYETGSRLIAWSKNTADIAETARKWTVSVECWN